MRSLLSFGKAAPAMVVALLLAGNALVAQDPPDKAPEVVYGVGHGVTAPKPLYTPPPKYAEKPRKKKIQGTVSLAIVVTADGKVRDVKVTKSLDKDLDQQAVAAVSTWAFEPATKDGRPVAINLMTEVDFRLY